MDDRNAQVGWTEAQWNRVREEVLRAWQRARVAGSFLPVDGALPPSTQVVPSEVFNSDGTVDERATAVLVEISLPVRLTRQQVREDDLSTALLQFRRRATQLGQLEDWYIFNGIHPRYASSAHLTLRGGAELPGYLPSFSFLEDLASADPPVVTIPIERIAGHDERVQGMLERNPGALGLIESAREARDRDPNRARVALPQLNSDGLIGAVVSAMDSLQRDGYVAPYVCVFGQEPYEAAHSPVGDAITFPRDRLEPLIGRELLHASAIDIAPHEVAGYRTPTPEEWQTRGVLLSLAGEPVDLAIGAEATAEFRQVDVRGHYIFSVYERFALRIKDLDAIAPLEFSPTSRRAPRGSKTTPAPAAGLPDEQRPSRLQRVWNGLLGAVGLGRPKSS
jgi:uncharacterized linocin/CFP29 family protein